MKTTFPQKYRMCAFGLPILSFLFLIAAFQVIAHAQSTSGSLHGTVMDPTGAVLPDSKVEVKNLGSGQVRTATTDGKGFYTITELAPGHYSVLVSRSGFAMSERADIQL